MSYAKSFKEYVGNRVLHDFSYENEYNKLKRKYDDLYDACSERLCDICMDKGIYKLTKKQFDFECSGCGKIICENCEALNRYCIECKSEDDKYVGLVEKWELKFPNCILSDPCGCGQCDEAEKEWIKLELHKF